MKEFPEIAAPSCPPSRDVGALVLGLGVHGLAVVRSLGRRGIVVDAADQDADQPAASSRYCRRVFAVTSLDDATVVDFLENYGRQLPSPVALFLTRDKTVPFVSEYRHRLARYFIFNLPQKETITYLQDKSRTREFLLKNNCRFPKTFHIPSLNALKRVANDIPLPCIVKPVLRTFGFKARVAESIDDLFSTVELGLTFGGELIIQEFVAGNDADIYFAYCYFDQQGQLLGEFIGRKNRQFPICSGIACETVGCDDSHVQIESRRLFSAAGYKGFGSTEFKKSSTDGRYYFIEFTVGRTDYNVACAIDNGIDLPWIGFCDLVGNTPGENTPRQRTRWVNTFRNMHSILAEYRRHRRGVLRTCLHLAKNFSPMNSFPFWALNDPAPFLMGWWQTFQRSLRKIGRILQGK